MDLPEFIIPCIFDINQEIARFIYENCHSNVASICMEEAFNINREELLTELYTHDDYLDDDEIEKIILFMMQKLLQPLNKIYMYQINICIKKKYKGG